MELVLDDIHVVYRRRGAENHAVRGVTISIPRGKTVALVGESGSGKTTVAMVAAGLQQPSSGTVRWRGDHDDDPTREKNGRRRGSRSGPVQMVFQHPAQSLDPQWRIGRSIKEPLRLNGVPRPEADDRVNALIEGVGLDPVLMGRFPHEVSGGQAQRVAIARALVSGPEIVVLDEPTSGLDQTIRACTLDLLSSLQERTGIGYFMITHDISSVRRLASRIVVLYRGRVVESADARVVLRQPRHPYTQQLIAAVPIADPRVKWTGLPNGAGGTERPPAGGPCPVTSSSCESHGSGIHQVGADHFVACTAA